MIRDPNQEEHRHDIARMAWSDEPIPVAQRLKAGLADLESRLDAERLRRRKPQPGLRSRLRQRIKAARGLLKLFGAERDPP
jgi:hypothetical protein